MEQLVSQPAQRSQREQWKDGVVEDIELAPVLPPVEQESANVTHAVDEDHGQRQRKTLIEVSIDRAEPPQQAKAGHDVYHPLHDDRVHRCPVYRLYRCKSTPLYEHHA